MSITAGNSGNNLLGGYDLKHVVAHVQNDQKVKRDVSVDCTFTELCKMQWPRLAPRCGVKPPVEGLKRRHSSRDPHDTLRAEPLLPPRPPLINEQANSAKEAAVLPETVTPPPQRARSETVARPSIDPRFLVLRSRHFKHSVRTSSGALRLETIV